MASRLFKADKKANSFWNSVGFIFQVSTRTEHHFDPFFYLQQFQWILFSWWRDSVRHPISTLVNCYDTYCVYVMLYSSGLGGKLKITLCKLLSWYIRSVIEIDEDLLSYAFVYIFHGSWYNKKRRSACRTHTRRVLYSLYNAQKSHLF